jgi:predicted ribosomally synthesized peptide with SipW-like signal peptide
MLIGTTFAWFTDTASTAVNRIQAGTLDIELQYQKADDNWENAEGKILDFKKAAVHEDEPVLWEPGCTYELPAIKILNKGNLVLEYKLVITGIKGDAKLNEAIVWTNGDNELLSEYTGMLLPNAETDPIIIKGHMKEDAGNEYQGLSIDGIGITVIATQSAHEHDSFNNDYDAGAKDSILLASPANIQDYLDGKYGSIDGKTIILSAGNYGRLELGRATKYPGSNTDYYNGAVAPENKKSYDEFVEIKNSGQYSPTPSYVRNMSNVTIKAAPGAAVTVAGITATAGHIYGDCYDHVLDIAYTVGSAYYLVQNWKNITFEGITFTAPSNIQFSYDSADGNEINGVTFRNCTFNIGSTAPGKYALRYYNEGDNGKVKNLTVENCAFNNCYQGVYTQNIKGITVVNSSFDTTGHNAIAIQSNHGPVNHETVIITGNTFANIGDRIIRFNEVGAGTHITIKNNTATNSGDEDGQVIKAELLEEGVTYDIGGNDWGEDKIVVNPELIDSF